MSALLIVGLVIYIVPTIVAAVRESNFMAAAIVINLFLGWTLIGWVVALAMAVSGTPKARR